MWLAYITILQICAFFAQNSQSVQPMHKRYNEDVGTL